MNGRRAQGGNNRLGKQRCLGVGRSTLGHNGDVRAQGGTHPSSLVTDDEDLGCVWEREGNLGACPRSGPCLPLAAWVHSERLNDSIDTPMESSMMTQGRA
jgi:hypothetical protein